LPELLFLMRFLGLIVFTAVAAYAIGVTPASNGVRANRDAAGIAL